jgi:hypothetical protein
MSYRGPLTTLAAGAAVTAVLIGLSFRAGPASQPAAGGGATPTLPTAGTLSAPASTAATPPAKPAKPTPPLRVDVNGTWAGKVGGTGTTLAIAVKNGTAVAYLCDGDRIEAWMRGTAIGSLLTMKAVKGNGRLTGTLRGDRASGQVTEAAKDRAFDIGAVSKPSGLYRATANVRGAAVVGGWIVLPSGRQVGLATVAGTPVRPSALNLATGTAVVNGGTLRPERQGGDG